MKNFCVLFLSIFLLLGCERIQGESSDEPDITAEQALEEIDVEYILAAVYCEYGEPPYPNNEALYEDVASLLEVRSAEPRFSIIPSNARPGEPVTIGFSYNFTDAQREFRAGLYDSRGRRLTRAAFFRTGWYDNEQEIRVAVLAVPSTALIGNAFIRIAYGDYTIRELPFTINHREFYSEVIALDQRNTELRTTPDPQRTTESQQIWSIFNRTGREIHTFGPFERPVTSTRRTSIYGSRRVFEYVDGTTDTAIHAGVDYGVPTGTTVRSSAAGRVVLARSRILTGNSIILEHLPGLYSLYYHMDSIAVNEGSIIDAGTFLGTSGATGLATGPHLHWEIRVSGENADPDAFLSRPVLDKNEIIDKLTAH